MGSFIISEYIRGLPDPDAPLPFPLLPLRRKERQKALPVRRWWFAVYGSPSDCVHRALSMIVSIF